MIKKLSLCLGLCLSTYVWALDIRTQTMHLYVGQSEFINDSSITNVAIGSDEILNATPVGNRGVLLTGLKSGDTTIKVWRKNSLQTINTHVYPANFLKIVQDIRFFMSKYPNTSVNIINDKIVVEGQDLKPLDKEKIDTFLSQFDYITNLTSVKNYEPDKNDQRMIYFDVKILEVSRTNMQNLGIQWDKSIDGVRAGIMGDLKKSQAYQLGNYGNIPTGPKMKPFATYVGLMSSISSRINLMESQGLARLIAHPVLSCKNGSTASFLSGGQIPYASASATGTPSVEYKDYGIKLDVSPTIQSDGSISAKISSEISEIDQSVVVDGAYGLLARKTQTEFSLKNAETLVLSGLNNYHSASTYEKVPGVSRVPVFGKLFQNKSNTDKQTELLFIVTPMIYSEQMDLGASVNVANTAVAAIHTNNQLLPQDFFNSTDNRIDISPTDLGGISPFKPAKSHRSTQGKLP